MESLSHSAISPSSGRCRRWICTASTPGRRHAVDRISALKRGLLIEFRNTYTNLASRRYGNLYRASDVPLNFTMNRWQVATLRLLATDRAVHLDPALWHPDDSDENVAVHLINAIISVPMVSVELDRYPQSHLDLIRNWIGFYNDHRDTIVDGEFAPEFHLGRVPLIRFTGEKERIIGLYDDIAFPLGRGPTPLWILNASTRPFVELLPDRFSGTHTVTTRDKFGGVVTQKTVVFPVPGLEVEVGGSLEIGMELHRLGPGHRVAAGKHLRHAGLAGERIGPDPAVL